MISQRYFQNQQRGARASVLALLLAASPVSLVASTARFEVTGAQVAAAMEKQSFPTQGVSIKLPAAITAGVQEPQLRIEAASMVSSHQARLRISCGSTAECLPFLAYATWPESTAEVTLPQGFGPKDTKASSASHNGVAALHAGSFATLQMEEGRIHIELIVVCLEAGTPGAKIHVATRDHKQSYLAEVVSSTLLKGIL